MISIGQCYNSAEVIVELYHIFMAQQFFKSIKTRLVQNSNGELNPSNEFLLGDRVEIFVKKEKNSDSSPDRMPSRQK